MLLLEGMVINVYKSPDYKDRETGTVKLGSNRIQLMVDNPMANGEVRKDLVTLLVEDPSQYQEGTTARIPVSCMARGSQVTFFAIKSSQTMTK